MIGLRDVGIALAVSRTTARDERDASLSDTVVSGDGSEAPVLHAPLVVSGELLGLMIVRGREGHRFRTEHRDLATTVVSQTAVAVKKIQLLERLSERNLTKDFFDDLAGGAEPGVVEGRARRLRCDLTQPRVVLWAGAPGADAIDWAGVARGLAGGGVPRRADRALRHARAGAAAGRLRRARCRSACGRCSSTRRRAR